MASRLSRSTSMLAVIASLLAPRPLCAQEVSTPADAGGTEVQSASDAEARGLFAAGRAAFADGRFEDARAYFQRSYELSHRPQLLYNLGTAEDRLRNDAAALTAFEQYLAALPDAENASEVRSRVEALRRSLAEHAPPPPSTPRAAASSTPVPIATIVLASVALVAGGASVGTWIAANDAYAERERGCLARGGCNSEEISGVASLVDATNGLWVASLVLGASAAVTLPLELTSGGGSAEATARLEIAPGRVGLEVTF